MSIKSNLINLPLKLSLKVQVIEVTALDQNSWVDSNANDLMERNFG